MAILNESSWNPASTFDSDLAWAKVNDYGYFDDRSAAWLPFLVLLKKGMPRSRFRELFAPLVDSKTVRIPPAFWADDADDADDAFESFLTLEIAEAALGTVVSSAAWAQCTDRVEFSAPNPTPVTTIMYSADGPETLK